MNHQHVLASPALFDHCWGNGWHGLGRWVEALVGSLVHHGGRGKKVLV